MFEIKVALLGYVSAGKSTVLNALLQDKFSEVAMRRATAGVNFFRVHTGSTGTCKQDESKDEKEQEKQTDVNPTKDDKDIESVGATLDYAIELNDDDDANDNDAVGAENNTPNVIRNKQSQKKSTKSKPAKKTASKKVTMRSAQDTLQEITHHNAKLRQTLELQEYTFDVATSQPLLSSGMMPTVPETKLVLIDIPGLNEAGSKDLFRNYVNEKWDTFDCVIAVMDVHQGVNTQEQVQLLELIQSNVTNKKNIPVIVLCNKVDDLDDAEVMMLVDEVRAKVNEVFECEAISPTSLNDWPETETNATHSKSNPPVFIPLSAGNAFNYRTALGLSMDDFKKLDKTLIDKLGREEVGRSKWRKMTVDEQYQAAYDAIHSESTYECSLEATNFPLFLAALNRSVGGTATQQLIVQKQLAVKLQAVSFDAIIAHELQKCREIDQLLGTAPPTPYSEYFWKAYERCCRENLTAFESGMDHGLLQQAMMQLKEYHAFALNVQGDDKSSEEGNRIVKEMAALVRFQADVALDASTKSDEAWFGNKRTKKNDDTSDVPPDDHPHYWKRCGDGWSNVETEKYVRGQDHPVLGKVQWKTLTPLDYCTIFESLLLPSYSPSFCDYFGREKVLLERVVHEYNETIQRMDNAYSKRSLLGKRSRSNTTNTQQGTLNEKGEFAPAFPDKFKLVSQLVMPQRLSDAQHWGHLAYMFCEFIDKNVAARHTA